MHHSNIKRQGGLQLIRGLHNLRQQHQKCVLTIGKFDGVHLGHQAVIVNLVEKAKELGFVISMSNLKFSVLIVLFASGLTLHSPE